MLTYKTKNLDSCVLCCLEEKNYLHKTIILPLTKNKSTDGGVAKCHGYVNWQNQAIVGKIYTTRLSVRSCRQTGMH